MTVPVIGITTYGRDEKRQFVLPSEYVDCVRRAGGLPLLIPPGEQQIDQLLGLVDAVVLAGGGDIGPELYGGTDHDAIYMVDAERDRTELEITRQLLTSSLPILAICRGTQIINVALGGTLHAHLPDVVGDQIAHRLPPREPVKHEIEIIADTRLAQILAVEHCSSMSWHHQAVRELGDGVTVAARAADGVIEAIEVKQHRWLVAVQWHPELSAARDPVQQRLFDAVVREAASK